LDCSKEEGKRWVSTCAICLRERPSRVPMAPMKATRPMGALGVVSWVCGGRKKRARAYMTIWSAATRFARALGLILPVPLSARRGNWRSRNVFHRPRKGPSTERYYNLNECARKTY
jgi:hypothetical protein